MTPEKPKEPTVYEKLAKLVNDHEALFTLALSQTSTGSFLIAVESTDEASKHPAEALPAEERFSERNAPVVIIVVKATPGAHENVAALLARYRGDDPKASAPEGPRKHWFG